MKRSNYTGLVVASFTGLLLASNTANAAAIEYNNSQGNNNFADPLNWSGDAFPGIADEAHVDLTGAVLNTAQPNGFRALRVGTSNGAVGEMTVADGGDLVVTTQSAWDSQLGSVSGSTGTLNVTGGSADINFLEVGRAGTGNLNVSGGIFKIARGLSGNSLTLGNDDTGTISGVGNVTVSGGLFLTRTGVRLGTTDNSGSGFGTFSVIGSASAVDIGSNGSLDGAWNQYNGSTLNMEIDAGGVTTIFIDDMSSGEIEVNFFAGSLLDLDFIGITPTAGTWTLMEAENTDINNVGLTLAGGVDPGWSFNIDNSGVNGLLTATYVIPEPSTFALLFVFTSLLVISRRRRA